MKRLTSFGFVAAVAAHGWPGVAVIVALIVAIFLGGAWVLSNAARTARLVTVIRASRSTDSAKTQ